MTAGAPALALARVLPAEAALARLAPAERALVPARATPKRRDELVAGRRAARRALSRLLGPAAGGALVLRAADGGRPLALSAAGAPLPAHVSITHAGGVAAALASAVRCGLDLVVVEPVERAFLEEAFAPEELAAWAALAGGPPGGPLAAACAFAAKEAAVKWLGTGLAAPLLAVSTRPAGPAAAARLGRLPARALRIALRAPGQERVLAGWVARAAGAVLVALAGAHPGDAGGG